jgi:hypothetical protein
MLTWTRAPAWARLSPPSAAATRRDQETDHVTETEAPADAGNEPARKAGQTINVTVAFPLGQGPFHGDFSSDATVGQVKTAAIEHFGVVNDAAVRIYLTHDGDEVADTVTVGEVAGHAKAVRFILAREVVNG